MSFDEYECWRCGCSVSNKEEPKNRVYCETCASIKTKEHDELIKKYALLKIRVMHETAIRIMEKAGVYMHEYIDSAKYIIDSALSETEKYMSSHEMVTAIVFHEFGFDFQVNYPVLNYIVDFYIPDIKVCLEVDGDRHEHKEVYDNQRDIDIRAHLGKEWEVIRIPVKYIEKNPIKIVDAAEQMREEKQRLREKHNGIIPHYFSRREKEHYRNVAGEKTQKVRKV